MTEPAPEFYCHTCHKCLHEVNKSAHLFICCSECPILYFRPRKSEIPEDENGIKALRLATRGQVLDQMVAENQEMELYE